MPRDPAGNFTLATAPVVTNTPITTVWWNTSRSDLDQGLSDSLDRTGNTGGMTGQLKLAATIGSVTVPSLCFDTQQNTGLYLANPGDVRLTLVGVDAFKWTSTGFNAYQSLTVAPTVPNGSGVVASADGTGAGLRGQSSSTSGSVGVVGTGVGGQLGLLVTSSAANIDVARVDGYISLANATNPAATTAFTNHLTPKNIPKAFIALSTNGGGGFTVADAFNVTTGSISLGLTDIVIPFAAAMANTNYTVVGNAASGQPLAFITQTKNTGDVHIRVMTFAAPGTPLGPQTNSFAVNLVVYGAQ